MIKKTTLQESYHKWTEKQRVQTRLRRNIEKNRKRIEETIKERKKDITRISGSLPKDEGD